MLREARERRGERPGKTKWGAALRLRRRQTTYDDQQRRGRFAPNPPYSPPRAPGATLGRGPRTARHRHHPRYRPVPLPVQPPSPRAPLRGHHPRERHQATDPACQRGDVVTGVLLPAREIHRPQQRTTDRDLFFPPTKPKERQRLFGKNRKGFRLERNRNLFKNF